MQPAHQDIKQQHPGADRSDTCGLDLAHAEPFNGV
jgi:hypothetical protein